MIQQERPDGETLEDLVEQFFAQGGELSPDVEEYARQHPEHADELREILPMMELLKDAAGAFDRGDGHEKLRSLESWVSGAGSAQEEGAATISRLVERLSGRKRFADHYVVKGEVGRGGQGAVMVVWDEDLHRNLAMKVLLDKRMPVQGQDPGAGQGPDPGAYSGTLGRFLEEAQVTAQLEHPGIVPVHELGLGPNGRVYFTMKLVKGRDLQVIFGLAREGKEDWNRTRALSVLLKVCEAMAYAHSKGVLHRDLKPSNVMVGRYGEVYVMDWGLAKALGRKDRKDIRIRPETGQGLAHLAGESVELDSPLLTMDGHVVGTPSYMAPEQAAGDLEAMGPHSDVYSIGCMLYQLLTGEMPYAVPGRRRDNRAVLRDVRERAPRPISELAPDVPAELLAVAEKAMAREPSDRFRDVSELADDLRAFLENRVVKSYQTGAAAELRKWVHRNKPLAGALAAAFVVLVAGLVVSLALRARAVAESESVFRLSALQTLGDLIEEADELWPAHPELIDAYVDWLDRARALIGNLPLHVAERDKLRAVAIPRTPEEIQTARENHPDFNRLEHRRKMIVSSLIPLRQRRDSVAEDLPEVDWSTLPEDVRDLNMIALKMANWRGAHFGEEALGFVVARRALELAEDGQDDRLVMTVGHTLSHAAFVLGRDNEAIAASRMALDVAPGDERDRCTEHLSRTRAKVDHARSEEGLREAEAEIAQWEAELSDLDRRLSERRDWRFQSDKERWWHNQLTELIEGLGALEAGLLAESVMSEDHGWSVPRRLALARELEAAFAPGGGYELRWRAAVPGIRGGYSGLDLSIQAGLVPIGRDPESGLWEFWHVASGEEPVRDEEGNLILTADTGLVLVLLPGGKFLRGAQSVYPDKPNYDPLATNIEDPVREIELSPFFLSKYEMTQAQWKRLTGRDRGYFGVEHKMIDSRVHPVESINWFHCTSVLARDGLELPTETQWEYGARAGTNTPWWTGVRPDSVTEMGANSPVHPRYGRIHVPVGSTAPNAFGLQEVLGNVSEWCRDVHGSWHYWRWSDKDPIPPYQSIEEVKQNGHVTVRGGNFAAEADVARVTCRQRTNALTTAPTIGVRPARAVSE